MALEFKRASRSQIPLKLGISGPSGSGKTTAALRLARGLVGPTEDIAMLDTENRSSELFADLTAFDALPMNPPYVVAKFTAAIEAAIEQGYKVLIIDSASMEWQELLTEKESLDARGGNSYANWASITKKHEDFLKAIRNAPIHLILCLRAKDKHEITEKDGRKSVVKLGQGSIMRDGFEYELTTTWDLAMDHSARAGKDRTRLFDGRLEQITEATGRELVDWLASGKPPAENTGQGFQAPTPTHPQAAPDSFAAAMAELAAASMGMPEKTRAALIAEWEKAGPAGLPALLKEIETIRQPETAHQAFTAQQQLVTGSKAPVSAEASAFVDAMDADTDEAHGGIDRDQYVALGLLIEANGINRDALRAYCVKAGHLLPSPHPTLARLKAAEFVKLRARLASKDAAKVVGIINKTAIPPKGAAA